MSHIEQDHVEQIFQVRPGDTNAVSVYSPDDEGIATQLMSIVVCETSGAARTFRIFHDADGTTYDETTALYWDAAISGDTTTVITLSESDMGGVWVTDPSSNLAVQSSFASALTFTGYGRKIRD